VTTTVPGHSQFDTEDRGVHPLVRLSPHYYNTEQELARAVDVVATLARSRKSAELDINQA
jgi:selenocysteine lyase/cysteine desulfurase